MIKANDKQYNSFVSLNEFLKTKLNIGKEILWLTKEECIKCGPTRDEILSIVEQTMIQHGKKEYEMPAKIGVHPFEDVFFHAMPAYLPEQSVLGIKWIECYPKNPRKYGLPQTTGLLVLNDIVTGLPVCVMDCTWITAMRTPAVTALSAAALAPNTENFGMFGLGVQGKEHLRFIPKTLKKLKKIYVYGPHDDVVDKAISEIQPDLDVQIIKCKTPKELVDNCETICSGTIILRDNLCVVKDEWIKKGQTLLPLDLNTFFDLKTQYCCDKYIVDSLEEHQSFADIGYFPKDKGLPKVYCETGEILAGLKPGRENEEEIIVCSNIGMATNDVAVAKLIMIKALEEGIGKKLPL